jgi:hypothetical protein
MSDYNNNLHEAYLSVYKSDQELALDYLVSEGYAETSEEAMGIYEQLEDGVIEGILDEIRGCGGKVDPDNGKYKNGESAAMLLSPRQKTLDIARRARMEAPSSGPGRSRHMARAEKMEKVAKSMKEEAEDLGEGKVDVNLTPLQKIRKRNQDPSLVMSAGNKTSERRSYHEAGRSVKKTKGEKSAFGTMRNVGGPYKEEFDTYDLVLEYLLDEGFADTEDSALQIMSNMSEDWRGKILENLSKTQEHL